MSTRFTKAELLIPGDDIGIGLHAEIPAAMYHALPYCSNSRLSILAASCPAKVRYEMDNPKEPTDAQILGDALHLAVLQPNLLEDNYVCGGQCEAIKQGGGRCKYPARAFVGGRWLCGVHSAGHESSDPRTVISTDDRTVLWAMRNSILSNPQTAALLERATLRELTGIWEHDSGLLCKARFDGLSTDEDAPFILDLKTTEDASPRGFERSIDTYGIARQGAFYLAGAAKLGLAIEDFVVVAVEKGPPYLVAVHRISDAALEAARRELRPLIEAYWLAETTGDWKGYEPRDADLPSWAVRRIENQ